MRVRKEKGNEGEGRQKGREEGRIGKDEGREGERKESSHSYQ